MFDYLVPIIISFVVCVAIGIVIEKFVLKMIDSEYCRNSFVSMSNSAIEAKIKKLEDRAFSISWRIGALIGCGISILFFSLKIFKWNFGEGLGGIIKGLLFAGLKFLGPIIVCIIVALFIAMIIVDIYCVKRFGKTLAFLDMVNNASEIRKNVCKETVLPFDETSLKYGDRYLSNLGKKLDFSIKKTVWIYRIIGAIIGFAGGSAVLFVLMSMGTIEENVVYVILAGIAGEAVFVIIFNLLARKYCIQHFGYLSTYYQLHIDIYSIKNQLADKEQNLQNEDTDEENKISYFSKKNIDKEPFHFSEDQLEKMKTISLKDGYQFASVSSRIFAEKIDAPGNYFCPYCYSEIYSDVSSMCSNCGKSLGTLCDEKPCSNEQEKTSTDETSSDKTVSTDVPNKTSAISESKTTPSTGNGKIFLIISIASSVMAVALALTLVFVITQKNQVETNNAVDAFVAELNYDKQPEKTEPDLENKSLTETFVSKDIQPENIDVFINLIMRCTSNLRLRESETFDSSVILTMNAGTKVKIIKIGRQDESDGISSNWVQVEVLPGGKDKDFNRIPNGTRGWCFGGYLESCSN